MYKETSSPVIEKRAKELDVKTFPVSKDYIKNLRDEINEVENEIAEQKNIEAIEHILCLPGPPLNIYINKINLKEISKIIMTS